MKTYGYVRVSSHEQNEDRQLIALRGAGIPAENIYADKQSGKDFDRPAYAAMLGRIGAGDALYVASIDRLGRNYDEIQRQWRLLTKERGVDIVVLDMPLLDTRTGKDLMGTFTVEHHALKRCAPRRRPTNGRKRPGRTVKKPPENFGKIIRAYERGNLSANEAVAESGLKEATFYRRLREHRAARRR